MPVKRKKNVTKAKSDPIDPLVDGMDRLMKVQDVAYSHLSKLVKSDDHTALVALQGDKDLLKKENSLTEEAERELAEKVQFQRQQGMGNIIRFDDGDQTPLKGDKAQILRNQWSSGMDCNPLSPANTHLSAWLRALWWGDYQEVMSFINNVKKEEVGEMLEYRESLVNISAVFHVIIGARSLRGDYPQMAGARMLANMIREVKNDHEKILAKLIELGVNINAKDVAGYTPLHHCVTCSGNSITLSMARQLLKAGADPNIQNRFGCTALFEPVMTADLEAVELLLEFGADPEIQDYEGGLSSRQLGRLSKVAELFSKADKQNLKRARAKAKTEAVNNITKKTHVNYVGDLPSKNHFVVKVQAGVVARPTRDPLLVYNKDRSLLGNLHREEQEVVYDMLVGKIREAGYKGLKGYFYVICSGEGTKSCKKKGKLHNIKINTEKILPVENW